MTYSGRQLTGYVVLLTIVRCTYLVLPYAFVIGNLIPEPYETAVEVLLAAALLLNLLWMIRSLRLRLRIESDGILIMDRLVGATRLDLTKLSQVRLDPDQPFYASPTGSRVPAIGGVTAPSIVLQDSRQTVRLPLSGHWSRPATLFGLLLDAADAAEVKLSDTVRRELAFMSGRSGAAEWGA